MTAFGAELVPANVVGSSTSSRALGSPVSLASRNLADLCENYAHYSLHVHLSERLAYNVSGSPLVANLRKRRLMKRVRQAMSNNSERDTELRS
jgi:hypothetical protein